MLLSVNCHLFAAAVRHWEVAQDLGTADRNDSDTSPNLRPSGGYAQDNLA